MDKTTGAALAGKYREEIEASASWVLWQPDAPFVGGREYEVTNLERAVGSYETDGVPTFVATAAIELQAADIEVGVSSLQVEQNSAGVAIWCTGSDLGGGSSCDVDTSDGVATHRAHVARYAVQLVAPERGEPQAGAQFIARGTLRSAQGEEQVFEWSVGGAFTKSFSIPAHEYCYEITLRSVIDESESTLRGCAAHGELGFVGIEELSSEEVQRALGRCESVTNSADLGLWCLAQQKYCNADEATCEERLSECPEGIASQPTDAGTLGAGEKFEDDALTHEAEHPSARACAVTSPKPTTPWLELGTLAIGLMIGARRQRATGAVRSLALARGSSARIPRARIRR